NTDACKIPDRPEMRHAFFFFCIKNFHRHLCDTDAFPGRTNQNLNFKLILPGKKNHSPKRLYGIETISALRVTHAMTSLHPEPKVRKPIAKAAFTGYTGLIHISGTYDDSLPVMFKCSKERGKVICKVLAIAVYRDSIFKSAFDSFGKTPAQRIPLACVLLKLNRNNRKGFDYFGCFISRPVVDHNNLIGIPHDIAHYSGKRACIVIRRDQYTNLTLSEKLVI